MADQERRSAWRVFLNRDNLKRPVFWLSALGFIFIIALILGIPAYVSTQNSYCASCHAMEHYYKTWESSTHGNYRCVDCHVEPGFANLMKHYARSTREIFTNLVGESGHSNNFVQPTNALCLSCHTEYRSVSASGDLIIPHEQHVKMRKLECVDCHRYLVHFTNPEGKNTPSMTICYKCHDGKKATKECKACHTKKAFPESHKAANWDEVHGAQAAVSGKTCAQCHAWTPRYCEDCHQKRPASHGGIAWRTMHKDQALQRAGGCYVCHGKAYCKNCHD